MYNKYSARRRTGAEKHKPEDRFSSIGEICMAIREEARPTANPSRRDPDLLRKLENVRTFQNSFGSEDPGAGGFLIPEIMRSELLELALEEAIVRSRATVIPMSTLRVPIPTVDDTSHVSSVFGGVTYCWSGRVQFTARVAGQLREGRARREKKLVGFFKVPNELLADAPAFSSWFDTRIPNGPGVVRGCRVHDEETGAGTPEGFIGSPGYVQVDRTHGLVHDHLGGHRDDVLPDAAAVAEQHTVWNPGARRVPRPHRAACRCRRRASGWAAGRRATPPKRPARVHHGKAARCSSREKVPSMLTSGGITGDINFVDLSYYLIGDRQAVAVSASEHAFFQNDQTAYRIIERVDGRPWLQTALTPHNGSASTLSAYVGLSATHT